MTTVDVLKVADDRFQVEVRDDDGSGTRHEVTVSDTDWERFGGGCGGRAELVVASFRFLLAREPKGAILGSFELGAIARYFPEYGGAFPARVQP